MTIEEWEGEILKEERIVFKFGPVLTGGPSWGHASAGEALLA